MLPNIISVGPFALSSYAVSMFAAFFAMGYVIWKRGKEAHFAEEELFDCLLIVGIWMMLGARVGYILAHFQDFGPNIWYYFSLVSHPGMLFVTGILSAGLVIRRQARINKWDGYSLSDVFVTGLTLALAIMAFGSFLNGNGAGIVANSWLGVRFIGMYDKRLPVQLYETLMGLGLFVFLWRVEGSYRTFSWYKGSRSEAKSGFITAMFFIFWGLFQALFCIIRPAYLVIFGVRADYMIDLLLVVYGINLLFRRSGGGIMKKIGQSKAKSKTLKARTVGTAPLSIGDDIFG
jgi:phosphatidylglycerol---prolipoprotein diacylglyceryl transferase